ncbi:MAG TPA: hypothetical protein VG327_03275 [Mycobacterium sp.]|jgi:hypothetical protein|nr:hypothetical protein [Mycobacterium sp.]
MITKMLVSAAILGSLVAGAAPANADPNQPDPNPFASLTCNCQETTPAGPAVNEELDRGIRAAFADNR